MIKAAIPITSISIRLDEPIRGDDMEWLDDLLKQFEDEYHEHEGNYSNWESDNKWYDFVIETAAIDAETLSDEECDQLVAKYLLDADETLHLVEKHGEDLTRNNIAEYRLSRLYNTLYEKLEGKDENIYCS